MARVATTGPSDHRASRRGRQRPTHKYRATSSLVLVVLTLTAVPAAASRAAPPVQAAPVECEVPAGADTYTDDTGTATLSIVETTQDCLRTYRLASSVVEDVREFSESPAEPRLRTGSVLLDGLYAMALDDARLNEQTFLEDDAYNDGEPVECPGGCYVTGANWPFVWTRDVAYAADLGLSAIDPERMRNTLRFKLSDRRDGSGDTQIIQDTGTGGSYPSSTDRVVWALGAAEVLAWLPPAQREEFAAEAYDAIRNTIEHDRRVVFDDESGLYLGEHSFLDWREQSYAEYTAEDVALIATSRSLSTNVAHWVAIDAASRLAADADEPDDAARYLAWADSLKAQIRESFWLADHGQFSQMLSTELDTSPVLRYDALGLALAVITGVATPDQAAQAMQTYPHTRHGPSVFWPQQQGVPAYHNNGIWPFVTSYLLRAAATTDNSLVASRQVGSLVRGAALFASNMENFDLTDGSDDTEMNSLRQLWSVAGMLSMTQQTFFGIDAGADGLRIDPYLPAEVHEEYFQQHSHVTLEGLSYRGHEIDVRLELPDSPAGVAGSYTVRSMEVDGHPTEPGDPIGADMLADESTIVVELGRPGPTAAAAPVIDVGVTEALHGPTTPVLTSVEPAGGRLQLTVDVGDEDPARVTMDVLRDGAQIATGLAPTAPWVDETSTEFATHSYCYSVRLRYTSSGNVSQHALPRCWWGPDDERVTTITGEEFEAVGGDRSRSPLGVYYANWGTGENDSLTARLTPDRSGRYLLQVDAAHGGPVNTGITSGIKMLRVVDNASGEVVTERVLVMPHTGDWDRAKGSTYVEAMLTAGTTYRLVLDQDRLAVNMSYFSSNALHNDARGGPSNDSNVFAFRAMLVTGVPATIPPPSPSPGDEAPVEDDDAPGADGPAPPAPPAAELPATGADAALAYVALALVLVGLGCRQCFIAIRRRDHATD